ncbi:MAG: DUF3488 domain-containing protein [Acidimicrobiia bacterium]|nr:DUF3488 domain-containing protein [Acidimicrobiia bacterium]
MTLVGMCILWLLAVTGFRWVFKDTAWIVPLVLATQVPLLIEWGARRVKDAGRRPALTVRLVANGLHVVGFIVVLAWAVYPESTIAGIPTPETVATFISGVESALQLVHESVAPLGSPPYLGIAVAAVWWCAAASGAGMWSSGAFGLAVAPPVTIFLATRMIVEGTPSESGGQLLMLVLVLVAAGTTIVAADRERFGGAWWTSLIPAAVVALTVVGGVIIAPLVPGYGQPAAWDFRNRVGTFVPDNPFTDIRSRLVDPSETVVFRVTSPEGNYWRLTSLDAFDGRRWERSDDPPLLPATAPPTRDLLYEVEIVDLSSPWLPVAPFPAAAHRSSKVNEATGSLDLATRTEPGVTWEVRSAVPAPSADDLRRAPDALPDSSEVDYYLRTDGVTEGIKAWIEETTAGTDTKYDAIMAMQKRLRTYTYSLEPDPGHSSDDLEHFLLETRTGYCEQFSAALAVLAREIGVPSRVATGYLTGERVGRVGDDLVFEVRGANAHAWTELWFPDYGWLPFEPTPDVGSLSAPYFQEDVPTSAPTPPTTLPPATPTTLPPAPEPEVNTPPGEADSLTSRVWAIVVLLVLVVTLLCAVPTLKWARRTMRRRTGHTSLRHALSRGVAAPELAAWRETLDWLTDVGVTCHPSSTPNEIAVEALGHGIDIGPQADLVTQALYAPEPPGHSREVDRAERMWAEHTRVRREFAQNHPRAARRAWLRPRSLLPTRRRDRPSPPVSVREQEVSPPVMRDKVGTGRHRG